MTTKKKSNNIDKKAESLAKAEQAKKAESLTKNSKRFVVKSHIFPNQKSRNYFIAGENVLLSCGEEVAQEVVSKFPKKFQSNYFEEI